MDTAIIGAIIGGVALVVIFVLITLYGTPWGFHARGVKWEARGDQS